MKEHNNSHREPQISRIQPIHSRCSLGELRGYNRGSRRRTPELRDCAGCEEPSRQGEEAGIARRILGAKGEEDELGCREGRRHQPGAL